MTDSELVRRFIEYYGGKPGEVTFDITPLTPYIIMDIAYQSYRKHIAPLQVHGRAKQIRKYWTDAYHRFNSQVFLPFTTEERDEVIDRMDEMGEYIAGEVKAVEDAILAYLHTKIDVGHEVIMCCLFNNILAQAAQELTRIASVKLTGRVAESRDLDAVRIWCIKFASVFTPPRARVNTSEDPRTCEAVTALSHKITQWIFK